MTESVLCFGPSQSLVGILSIPSAAALRRPAVLMWNVGLNHRVGPSRCWVELSRRLAAQGIAAFRFDIGGLGDSAPRQSGPSDDVQRAVLDLKDALKALQDRGWTRFVLVSNCSGTDASHIVAARDARITAAVYLDGYTYQTPKSQLLRRLGVYLSKRHWKRWLRTKYPGFFNIPIDAIPVGSRVEIYEREYPPRQVFETDLDNMVNRGVQLLYIYSGETSYLYKNQFWDWLVRSDWNGLIELEYYPDAGHIYSEKGVRMRMLSRVERFLIQACV